MSSPDREISVAVERLPRIEWEGTVWRAHWRSVAPDDWRLSLETSGRFHRARDLFPPDEVFPALYTSLDAHVAVWEMVRQRVSTNPLFLQNNRLSRLQLSLRAVLDCSDLPLPGIDAADLRGPDRTASWAIGAAAVAYGADGLIVPSAALVGCNLIVFPMNLPREWRAGVLSTQEMPIELPADLVDLLRNDPR